MHDDVVLDGHSDYRVPDVVDLRSIRVCSAGATALGGDGQDACGGGSTVPTIDNQVLSLPSG